MGYDISAYFPNESAAGWPIAGVEPFAEMSAGGRSRDVRALFEALNATEFDGVVSGNAGTALYSPDELRKALNKVCQCYVEGRTSERVVRFLASVAERAENAQTKVFIWFC